MIEFIKNQKNEDDIQEKIKNSAKGYYIGTFHNYMDIIPKKALIWYSYDLHRKNFHIVPDISTMVDIISNKNLHDLLYNKLNFIMYHLNKRYNSSESTTPRPNCIFKQPTPRAHCAKNHQYIKANRDGFEYLILLSRLWHEEKKVNNTFGRIQFMCYPEDDKQINLVNGDFEMMYPETDNDDEPLDILRTSNFSGREKSGHFVYNPKELDVWSDPRDIADAFIDFMKYKIN